MFTADDLDRYGLYLGFGAFVAAVCIAGVLLAALEYIHTRRSDRG